MQSNNIPYYPGASASIDNKVQSIVRRKLGDTWFDSVVTTNQSKQDYTPVCTIMRHVKNCYQVQLNVFNPGDTYTVVSTPSKNQELTEEERMKNISEDE